MKLTLTIATLATAVAGGLAAPAAASATTTDSPVVGHVYVNDNTVAGNAISGFDRHADGTLTALAASPFAAGGAGSGGGLGSQGALQRSSDGRFLLAVDAGSNQISVLKLGKDGSVSATRPPVSSHGVKPVSIAVTSWGTHDLVYVANAGDGGANYTGFTLNHRGYLHHLASSTVAVPDGSQLGDVLFNSDGSKVAGTRVGSSLVDSFNVGRNGLIYAAPGSPYVAQGLGPIGAEFRPTNLSQLFVSNAHDGPNNGTVSAFHVGRSGALTAIGESPFPDNQTAPCWVEISSDGRHLFTTNTAVPSLSRYSISPSGVLTLRGTVALDPVLEKGPTDLRLTPDGDALYVLEAGGHAIGGFGVDGGNLSALSPATTPLPADSSPVGIVVD